MDNIGTETPASAFSDNGNNNNNTKTENALKSRYRANTEHINAGAIAEAHNNLILDDTKVKIAKGIQAGITAEELLLIALQGIDRLTGSTAMCELARGVYSSVHTGALKDKNATAIELKEAIQRLEYLRQAQPKTEQDADRIKRAIALHEEKIKEYKMILNK